MNSVATLTEKRQLVYQTSNGLYETEMAALCPGVQYGLSSQQNFGENKDLIFVKLTDSALRAIEEYIKNQNKFSHNPTIKFIGNENGELSFPTLQTHHHHHGGRTLFSFTMSSTADMEGQGGSFECVKQAGSPRGPLECLGGIPYKIRVHANDDVYEATRNRMTEAEDKYKNKCTREIKPNQTDIGRKVKLKQVSRLSSLPIRKEQPSMRDHLLKPSAQQTPPLKPTPPPTVHSSTGPTQLLSNGLGSNHVSSSRPMIAQNKKPSVPDIAKRPLKERLIHLLAMKPFKKIELHDRLNKEGLRERNGMTSVLKQIASMKDNCFHLNRNMWSEVHENWPFYTESERQMLKRRKPQNLTPPGANSDGGSSSGSGQSPTSTHPGSPPPPPPVTSAKRPGLRDSQGDGLPYKRQRIAHGTVVFKDQYQGAWYSGGGGGVGNNMAQQPERDVQRRPITDSRDASNMNPRSRESPAGSPYFSPIATSAGDNGYSNPHSLPPIGSGRASNRDRSNTFDPMLRGNSPALTRPPSADMDSGPRKEVLSERHNVANGRVEIEKNRERDRERNKFSKERIARVSPDSQTEGISAQDLDGGLPKTDENEFPDYTKQYVTVQEPEQRRRYKADFNADYAEYRDLHGIVEKVSKRFAQLEERLKQEDENSSKYKDIKKQIVREYQENKKDLEHQRLKRRFQYLHDKLSHIKRLVLEYDQNGRTADARY